jgi:glycosyltransferase involved in cell wall biosynthesis
MTLAQQVSFNGETTIILIPAFNESMVVGAVIKEIKAHCNLPIVVIDDASTDNTVDVA